MIQTEYTDASYPPFCLLFFNSFAVFTAFAAKRSLNSSVPDSAGIPSVKNKTTVFALGFPFEAISFFACSKALSGYVSPFALKLLTLFFNESTLFPVTAVSS